MFLDANSHHLELIGATGNTVDPGTVGRVYELRARVAGRVEQVEVDEGQLVAEEDLIAYRDNSALRRRFETTLGRRGLEPRNAFVCTEMNAVRALASKGLGVAVLPRSIAELDGPPVIMRPVRPERITWPIAPISPGC